MKAFILAAGYGTRMRPLTDTLPKPLLTAGGKPLIQYHVERLADAGVTQLVINTAYLGEQIEHALGNGAQWGVSIRYSREGTPLETGGAIVFARDLIGDEPFLLVNGDIYCDYPLVQLMQRQPEVAHLVLVPNPEFNQQGDFSLVGSKVSNQPPLAYTYAGIGVYNPGRFQSFQTGESFALGPWLRQQAEQQCISAEAYTGFWMDIGTPSRLKQLDTYLRSVSASQDVAPLSRFNPIKRGHH